MYYERVNVTATIMNKWKQKNMFFQGYSERVSSCIYHVRVNQIIKKE